MNYLTKIFNESIRSIVLQYGFKKRNNTYYRVVDDVMQSFTLKKYQSGRACTIEFGVLPLCCRIFYVGLGGYNLRRFEVVTHYSEWDHWEYDKETQESMDHCVNKLVSAVYEHLIPFFELANSCKTALSELILLEKTFNDNRVTALNRDDIKDGASSDAELNLVDSVKYYMALKNGDYDFALKCLQAILKQNIKAYQSVESFLSEKKLQGRMESINQIKAEIEQLEIKNEEYFFKKIQENEANSMEILIRISYI